MPATPRGWTNRALTPLAVFLATLLSLPASAGIVLPTDPLTTGERVPANVMFILDNSTSMSYTTGWRMANPDYPSITGGSITSTELEPNNDVARNFTGIRHLTHVGNTIFYDPGRAYQS